MFVFMIDVMVPFCLLFTKFRILFNIVKVQIHDVVQSMGSFTLQKVQKSLYLAGIFYQAYY
jgi:hypothetical protein